MPRGCAGDACTGGIVIRTAGLICSIGVAALGLGLASVAAGDEPRNVLVVHSNNRLAPGNIAADRGLREAIVSSADPSVHIFSEFLDQPAFGGEAYERTVTTYLREKYASRPPNAIVAVSDNAFDFLLRHRHQLFDGVPLVHLGVSKSHLQSIANLSADVVGVPIEYDFSGTIEQALRWHPGARQLVIVTGAAERDRGWEARLRREVPLVAGSVGVTYLSGLSTDAMRKASAASSAPTRSCSRPATTWTRAVGFSARARRRR